MTSPARAASPLARILSPSTKVASPPAKFTSPPPPKPTRSDSKTEEVAPAGAPRNISREQSRDGPVRSEKLSLVALETAGLDEGSDPLPTSPLAPIDGARREDPPRNEESNGVGDKIKIFEKAAEDAATGGRTSRAGSVRRARPERLPSDELPPPPAAPATPAPPERPRAEPQRIVRPEFRPLASPAEVTIRSPSLGAKAPERFPSRGTAFRNVGAAPTPAPALPPPADADKPCKARGRERPTASRGSTYFARGSEEIWLVKKKDIEEIEERVLESFRRGARGGYARSESLEAGRGGAAGGAHTLKRQSSVACTCGHDKKGARASTAPRPRSRSHGDPAPAPPAPAAPAASVLDKYETLV